MTDIRKQLALAIIDDVEIAVMSASNALAQVRNAAEGGMWATVLADLREATVYLDNAIRTLENQ